MKATSVRSSRRGLGGLSCLLGSLVVIAGAPSFAQETFAEETSSPPSANQSRESSSEKEATGQAESDADTSSATSLATPGPFETRAAGAMVFIDPETGELTSEPAPGQLQRLLAQGRALARERSAATGQAIVRQPSAAELISHTAPTFVTPVGIGTALDDRFLQGLHLSFSEDGKMTSSCRIAPATRTSAQHQHSTATHAAAPPEEKPTTKASVNVQADIQAELPAGPLDKTPDHDENPDAPQVQNR